jgi:hypothetical protein
MKEGRVDTVRTTNIGIHYTLAGKKKDENMRKDSCKVPRTHLFHIFLELKAPVSLYHECQVTVTIHSLLQFSRPLPVTHTLSSGMSVRGYVASHLSTQANFLMWSYPAPHHLLYCPFLVDRVSCTWRIKIK